MSAYYNEGIQVIVGNGQNFPGTPRVSLIPFIQRAYDKGLLNFTTLPPGSISLAEIQNISTSKLLGRSTAGTGVIEELTIGTGLSLAGGILSNTATASPPGGSDTQIQYNNAGAFAGSSQLIANIGATNTLDITGSGNTSATNALRVRNSSGTNLLTLNNASGATMVGADNSDSTYVISATNLVGGGLFRVRNSGEGFEIGDWTGLGHSSALRFTRPSGGYSGALFSQNNANFTFNDNNYGFQIISNTTASKPALHFTGTGYSGGTATTTKPTLLIEPTGTTSTGWSTSGTKLGVNAESGFTGNLLDLQVNGATKFRVDQYGKINASDMTGQHYSGATVTLGGWWKSSGLSSTDGIYFGSSHKLYWGNSTINISGLKDVAIGRGSAGVLEVNNGTAGTYGAIQSLYDRFGSGSPESVVTAPIGAVYHRTDGGAGTSFYVKESGTGNTGWVGK